MTRRTFGLGMSAVALSLLGTAREEGLTMTTAPPEPDPTEEPATDEPKPPKEGDGAPLRRPY